MQVSAHIMSSPCTSNELARNCKLSMYVSALVGVHSEQCWYRHILSCIEGFACDCMCMHSAEDLVHISMHYEHPEGWPCICWHLQASRAVDVSAYNG